VTGFVAVRSNKNPTWRLFKGSVTFEKEIISPLDLD
jgi:hypothetical protein